MLFWDHHSPVLSTALITEALVKLQGLHHILSTQQLGKLTQYLLDSLELPTGDSVESLAVASALSRALLTLHHRSNLYSLTLLDSRSATAKRIRVTLTIHSLLGHY